MEIVLLVDDDEAVRHVVSRMLARLGYTTLIAASGAEAAEIYRRRSDEIDCVILDLLMSGMDGEATFLALRDVREDVCVILASGFDQDEVIKRYAGLGFAGFIQKPFSLAALKQSLDNLLNSRAI